MHIGILYCITGKSLGMTTGLTLSARCMHFVRAIQNVEGNGHSSSIIRGSRDTVARNQYECSRDAYVEQ